MDLRLFFGLMLLGPSGYALAALYGAGPLAEICALSTPLLFAALYVLYCLRKKRM